ncbi:MAG: hypothetical protein Q8P95_03155, partial [bacterium]|nr:hypothetical protein [bacterium]
MAKKNKKKSQRQLKVGRDPRYLHDPSLPWKKIFLIVGLVFFTGLTQLLQQHGDFLAGEIIGEHKTVLHDFSCPRSGYTFEVSPVPGLFSYRKGDLAFNRSELLRLNENNMGLTAWFTYAVSFDQASKGRLLDIVSYEQNPNEYARKIFEEIEGEAAHGGVDFVTTHLSPDNPHLNTAFPYSQGLVVDLVRGHAGYGNFVSVCSDLVFDDSSVLRVLYSVA